MLMLGFNIHFKRTAAFYTEAVFNHDFFIRLQSYSFSRTYNDIPRGLFVDIFLTLLDVNFPLLGIHPLKFSMEREFRKDNR